MKNRKKYIVEIFTIIIGGIISLLSYLDSLDGIVHTKYETLYEAKNPEIFWNRVIVGMVIGAIIAGCGLLSIYLNKENSANK